MGIISEEIRAINMQVERAIKSNNIVLVAKIFQPSFLPHLLIEEKETSVFIAAMFYFQHYNDRSVINYLIFDYQIDEEKSRNSLNGMFLDKEIIGMFDKRRLNESLSKNLNNDNKIIKKLKI